MKEITEHQGTGRRAAKDVPPVLSPRYDCFSFAQTVSRKLFSVVIHKTRVNATDQKYV